MKALAAIILGLVFMAEVPSRSPVSSKAQEIDALAEKLKSGVKVTSGPFKGTVATDDAAPAKQPATGLQASRWASAKVNPKDVMRIDKTVMLFQRTEAVYQRLEAKRSNGVPAPIIFCFHMRESDCSMARHLHEGSLLTHRTVDVPRGRIPNVAPPYTFEVSAEDALYVYEGLEKRDWDHLETALQAAESYNGLGYQKKGRVSPYMWAGTSPYTGGKYVKDGVFSSTAYDQQLGVCAVLKRMQERGIVLKFDK